MICNPKLIPRVNIDYNFTDFFSSISNLKSNPDFSPIRSIFSDVHISFTNSGRTSLYVILKALNLPEGSKIGVPLYSCPSVFEAIIHSGNIPLFIDIDPENYTLSPEHLKAKIAELDAVIVIHTFGRPADLEKIIKIAGNRPVIEDCAHALLSEYKGKLLGTIATVGFFTFRTGKYISAGEGGMITTGDPNLAQRIRDEIEKLPTPSVTDEIRHVFVTYIRSALYKRPWFGLVSLPLGRKVEKKVDLMNKHSFNTTKIRNTDLHLIIRKIHSFKENVEKQRENSLYLIKELNGYDLYLPVELGDTYCNYYMFPIQFQAEFRDEICEILLHKGIDTAKLFSKTPSVSKLNYGYTGDCPATEQLVERLLVIPSYYTLTKDELNKIKNVLIGCL